MPRFKKLKKLPKLDMNPMVDMAFLLVSFFMMTTTFKTESPFEVDLPDSHAEVKVPEKDICIITVGESGEIYLGLPNQFDRLEMLEFICRSEGVRLSEEQSEQFSKMKAIGSPIAELDQLLGMDLSEIRKYPQSGIPIDSAQNEFKKWIMGARIANPRIRFAIEADRELKYPIVRDLIESLRDLNISRFNLITENSDAAAT